MRGRTNIPPRLGGIVNGVVREYQVADGSEIAVGDYVELLDGSGVFDTESNTLYTTLLPWAFGAFLLSDRKVATFYFYDKKFGVRVSTIGNSGFLNEGVKTEFDLSGINSPVPNSTEYDDINVIELEQNRFLLFISNMGVGGFALITYENNGWIFTPMSTNAEFVGSSSTSIRSTYSAMCAIDSSHIAISFSNKVYIGKIDNYTMTFGDVTTMATSSTSKNMYMLNGYLFLIAFTYLTTFTVNTERLSATIVSNATVESFTRPMNGCVSKLTDNKIIVMNTKSSTSTSSYLYATIITVNENGSITIARNKTAVSTFKASANIMNGYAYVFADGRILLLCVLQTGGSSYAGHVYACMGVYDSTADTVSFGELSMQGTTNDWKSTSSASGAWYLSSVELDNGIVYSVVAVGTHTRQIVLKIEQNTIVALSEYTFVKEYMNRINGIAKTAGSAGNTIEVYSPE